MYYLGIDAGGTKTAFGIMDENKKLLASYKSSTIHHLQVSYDKIKEILSQGLEQVCKKANIMPSQIKYAFLGIAGYEVIEDVLTYRSLIDTALKGIPFECSQDVINAWAGALYLKNGIILISGTGSVAYGKFEKKELTIGGWGPIIGDEGSAYYLALKLINEFSKQADGRKMKTPIYNLCRQELNLKKDADLINLIHQEYKLDRTKIAAFSKILTMAAKEGCNEARKIFEEASYELAQMAFAVVKKLYLDKNDKIYISYLGGVFQSGEFILKPLQTHLKTYFDQIELIAPKEEPLMGACLYAKHLFESKQN